MTCALNPHSTFVWTSTGGQELLSYIRKSAQVSQKTASQRSWASEGALVSEWEDVSGFICQFFFFTMGYSLFFNCESKKYYLKLKMPKATLWEENSRPFVEHPHRARIILCRWENPIIYQVNAWKTIDFMFLIISNQRIWFFPFQNGWHSCIAPDRRVIQAFIDI